MPSHDLPSAEIVKAIPGELTKPEADTFLDKWRKELKFDFEMELGKVLQTVAKSQRMSSAEKAEILIKAASALKALGKRDGTTGKPTQATQVNVYTSDPTKA